MSPASDQLSRFVLRYIDGSPHPLLVEEVWDMYEKSTGVGRGSSIWPRWGEGWEKLGPILTEYEAAGQLVSCTNVDSVDHPHFHLTQGRQIENVFLYGTPPMHLRFYATPDGSIAWQNELAARRRQEESHAQAKAARKAERADATYRAIAAGINTDRLLRRKLGLRRAELDDAIAQLLDDGQIKRAGSTGWLGRQDQWQAIAVSSEPSNGTEDADARPIS